MVVKMFQKVHGVIGVYICVSMIAVSYTHLDVYKRQGGYCNRAKKRGFCFIAIHKIILHLCGQSHVK